MRKCVYRHGGSKKYVLEQDYKGFIPFTPSAAVDSAYATLGIDSYLHIYSGYQWDGASGPTIDTEDTMDGALVHDVLYQFMREGVLDYKYRKDADKCIRSMCIADGMPKWRANYWYFFLRLFGGGAARG